MPTIGTCILPNSPAAVSTFRIVMLVALNKGGVMKKIVFFTVCVAAVCLLATQAWSQAHYYMTLEPGNFKVYDVVEGEEGTHGTVWPLMEFDGWTYLRHRVWDGEDILYQWTNLYSLDAEGNVWYFGMWEQDQQPAEPILFVDAPLYAGKTWEQTVDYPGYGERHYSFECEAEEELTVPYGTFWCYRVRRIRTIGEDVEEGIYWYCDGIGKVKFHWVTDGGIGELANGDTVIPVEKTTWGAVKNLYR